MSFAYMPLFTGDYLRDTRHLSMSEHGAFLLLLAHCWDQKGPAPLDERKLMGICNARSTDEIEAMRRVLQEFFIQMDDGWYNKRMQTEIERSESISHQRSEAGKRGFQARAKQLPSKSQASAKQVHLSPSPSPSLSPPPTQASPPSAIDTPSEVEMESGEKPLAEPKGPASRSTRLPPDWILPAEWAEWAKREQPGWSDADLSRVADKFRDHWLASGGKDARKVDWLATWRNWVRREYLPKSEKPSAGRATAIAAMEWMEKTK